MGNSIGQCSPSNEAVTPAQCQVLEHRRGGAHTAPNQRATLAVEANNTRGSTCADRRQEYTKTASPLPKAVLWHCIAAEYRSPRSKTPRRRRVSMPTVLTSTDCSKANVLFTGAESHQTLQEHPEAELQSACRNHGGQSPRHCTPSNAKGEDAFVRFDTMSLQPTVALATWDEQGTRCIP